MKRRHHSGLRYAYVLPRLSKVEYATLRWLAARGYDGDILRIAGVEKEYSDGGARLGPLTEPMAWEFRDYIESDPDAFLSCNGSRSLADKLWALWEKIV